MNDLTNEKLEEIKEMATDAAQVYGEQWLSALVGGKDDNYNAITSDHTNDVVVRAEDDKRESAWLCDYLEAVSPGEIISIIDRLIAAESRLHDVAVHCANVEAQLAELQKQEPIFFINVDGDDWIQAGRIPGSAFDFTDLPDGVNKLYAAPVPPAVPDEKFAVDYIMQTHGNYSLAAYLAETWNSCRAAMLRSLPVPLAKLELTDEQIDAVLDSRGNIKYVIADKRERLRMFAREILRVAMLQLSGNSEQVPPAIKRVIHDAMHNGHGFMEVGTDGIRHVDRADVLIPPEANSPVIPDGWRDGIEAAARWVDQLREAFDSEHGWHDPDTNAFEFGNSAQEEYSSTLLDIAEGIRSLIPQADAVKGQA